jgi:flagellar basal-body rod protein FlgG
MIQSLYNASSGMRTQQMNIDTVSNNISNINTYGFKKSKALFKDALYVTLHDQIERERSVNLQRGNGAILSSIKKTFNTGHFVQTDSTLDVAIQGRGFFVIQNEDGVQGYTRDGSFHLSSEEEGTFLVNEQGYYVIGNDGDRIQIQGNAQDVVIESNGNIYSQNDVRQFRIVDFTNSEGLDSIGENIFLSTEVSGEPTEAQKVTIKQKYLETSNVDLTEEMTNLIKAQRIYQVNSKALQVADEMEAIANNLRA